MVNDWTAALKNSPDADSETEKATGKKRKDVNNLGSWDNEKEQKQKNKGI